jgi:hypothetical protein
MAIVNGYTTLEALKGRLGSGGNTDANDAKLEQIIEAASREIDGLCNRHFYPATAATRIFTAEWGDMVFIDDLTALTTLETDDLGNRTYSTTWTANDYDLEPYNAAQLGRPYTGIMVNPNSVLAFPRTRRGVRITGDWGWPSIPEPIAEACLMIAVRLNQTAKAPFGTAGTVQENAVQYTPRVDPVVRQLLDPYRRFNVGFVGG